MHRLDINNIFDLLRRQARRPLSLKEIQAHLSLDAGERKALGKTLKALVKEGSLVQLKGGRFALPDKVNLTVGRLRLHRDGYGFVTPSEKNKDDVYVPARHIRPAMHDDLVIVRLEHSIRSRRPEGRVIRVEQRAHKTLVGRYELNQGIGYVIPADPLIQEAILVSPALDRKIGQNQMVLVEIESYPDRIRGAVGQIKEVLGNLNDPEVEVRIAAIKFDLPYTFSKEALDESRHVSKELNREDLKDREDLSALNFVTIDSESAQDFDDAVAIEKCEHGFRLTVAIADVAHYVPVGSALDGEAFSRGTSVYFPGVCLPMLPESLSNGICSLKPNVTRLVVAVILDFDDKGRRTGLRFCEGFIVSRARLNYNEVATVFEDANSMVPPGLSPFLEDLQTMRALAELLFKLRHRRGSLNLDLPETEVELDLKGHPKSIFRIERNWAHRLIEEFMLATNEAVAGWLVGKNSPVVFRIHEAPSASKMELFQQFIAHFNQGIIVPEEGITAKQLQDLLERISGETGEQAIKHVLLRSLPQAYYSTINLGHFGLAAERYCHFTSPIRRYPDLTIQRILKQHLSGRKPFGHEKLSLDDIARQSSATERKAMEAERDMVNLKKCQYLLGKVGEKHQGVITSVHAFGFFVELQGIFAEGLVHVSSLKDDFYEYEEDKKRLIGVNQRCEFSIGTPVEVYVENVNLDRREIDFLLSREQRSAKRSRAKIKKLRKGNL